MTYVTHFQQFSFKHKQFQGQLTLNCTTFQSVQINESTDLVEISNNKW
jgi:hypothetical protein